ncbi:MAG: carboxypeptidase-like regulatory domain-containing protein [Terracidiphilus sp.]
MKRVINLLCCMSALFVLASLPVCYGQEDVSGMTGEITDPSGAAVTNAVVILMNPTTGLKFTQTTNAAGVYRFSEIPPGQGYEARITSPGFAPLDIRNIYLTVATVRTQNAVLKVGGHTEAIEVTASNSEVTIDTTDATVGSTFDVQALNNLPVQQRNDPTALFTMQPGVTDTASVTGARVDQNDVTLDGLDVNDFATGGAVQNNTGAGVFTGFEIVGHAPIDSVEEFHADVAGVQASTGPSSGGQFQLVTKSGTNQFHGNVNEYHRDPSLVANNWFSNNSVPIVPRNHLIENQFGGNIGGPVIKNKLFFFFDYNNARTIRSTFVQRTVPLDTLRNGYIGYINSAASVTSTGAIAPGGITYVCPSTCTSSAPGAVYSETAAQLDPAAIGEDTTWVSGFNKRFPHSNNAVTGDGVNSGGFAFNAPDSDYETNYVGRGDYNLSDTQKLYARFTIVRENGVEDPNEFAGDPPTDPVVDRTYAFVIGHDWVLGNNKTNRVYLGETVQKLAFPNTYNPDGSTFFTFDDGTGPALASSLYLNPNAQSRRVPIPVVGDDFTWAKGSHTLQFGGTFKDILAHNTNIGDYNATELGMGGNILSLCGPTPAGASPACGGTNPDLRPSDIYVAPSNASMAQTTLQNQADYDWDQAFTFMLARIGEISADFNYTAAGTALPQLTGDQRFYRYYQTQLYFQDTWKVMPSLTLTYGLTYQLFSVPYETRGLESTEPFSFDKYFNARVAQSAAGQTGPTAVPLIPYVLGGKANNGPPLYQPQHGLFAPHVGFAYNLGADKKTVINGSVGMVYDRTIINAVQFIQDEDSYLFQQSEPIPLGVSGDPYTSLKTGPRLDSNNNISTVAITPPATPKPPYYPFVADGQPYGLQIGSAFNATIDPTLKTPYSIGYNFGVQRQLQGDMVLKLAYVGRLGRRLLAQTDANQVLDFPDPASGQLLSVAFANVTKQLRAGANAATIIPQPWFEDIMGAGYTSFMVANWGPFAQRGDFGDTVWFLAATGAPLNIGSAAQFSENTFYGNKGMSSYNALLVQLQKNFAHGLQFAFNYTWGHSLDNVSFFANSEGDTGIGGTGLVCDAVRPNECWANSDFDENQIITGDATYELPFGKNKMFLSSGSTLVNELVGGWSLSGINDFHTGQAWGTNSNAFVASYSNDAPGILIGSKSAVATHLVKPSTGGVNIFASQANAAGAYEGPIGFQIGERNGLRGPHYFDADLGLAKIFPIVGERVNLKFRADAFNAFNHPSFEMPSENVYNGLDQQDITSSTFGDISYTVEPPGNENNGARVLQLSLRLEF